MRAASSLALVFRAGAFTCALPISNILEIMRPLGVEPLVNMPMFVRGLAIIRGTPVPVVDLGALLGTDRDRPPTRFVTIRIGERRVALGVHEVIGVRDLQPFSISEMPPLLSEAGRETIEALGLLHSELLLLLQTGGLAPRELWETLDHLEANG
jgi:purine-binding chemotaxis protein CheW